MAKESSKASLLSWRTLMRKASKAASPAEAKRLRTRAAEQRRAERAKRVGTINGPWRTESIVKTKALPDHQFERATEVPRNDLEASKLAGLEAELARRDQQLIDEFISGVADLRRRGPRGGDNPNFIIVPNSAIDAILKVLTRK